MDADKLATLQIHIDAISALLYEETDPEQVQTLEGIEQAIRGHLLETVGPQLANFLSKRCPLDLLEKRPECMYRKGFIDTLNILLLFSTSS